jgi:hypothetical protein
MKKILLASTILVGTAGFAAADTANFSFSGSAGFGVAYNTTTATLTPTTSSSFTAGMSTTTDMGLEAGASIEVTAGGYGVEDDNTDTAFGAASLTAAGVGDTSLYLSGDFGKLTVAFDGSAGVFDTNYGYSYTFGDFTVAVGYDWNAGAANDAADLRVDYAFGDYSVYAQVNAGQAGGWSADTIDFGGTAAMSGFSLGVDATYTISGGAIEWKATAGYASGAYSVSAFIQDDNGVDATNFDYGLSGSYDLGGGVSVDAGYTYDNDLNTGLATVGVSMTF